MKIRKREWKEVLGILLLGIFVGAFCVKMPQKAQATEIEMTELKNPRVVMNTCDTVYFGHYLQEDTNGDGKVDENDEKQPVRWRILSQEGNDAYVIADKVLDCKPYNTENTDVTWDVCSLREWLNDYFYNTAFSKEEQSAIIEQTLTFGYNAGEDTQDKVFLPSNEDMENEFYGFSNDYLFFDQARIGYATEYAKEMGIYTDGDMGYNCMWWLRSVALNQASIVYSSGNIQQYERKVGMEWIGVRPVLHLDLSSSNIIIGEKLDVSLESVEWDTVELGRYDEKPITWRVLQISEQDVFLLADQILTDKAYMTDFSYIEEGTDKILTWQESEIRKWLNDEFYKTAFSESEKKGIVKTLYNNEDNPLHGTKGGDDTTDNVTLLSLSDVMNKEYGFPTDYSCEHPARSAAYVDGEEGQWVLRTLGKCNIYGNARYVSGIPKRGDVIMFVRYVETNIGIRPALHFDMSVYSLKKKGMVVANVEHGDLDTSDTADKLDTPSVTNNTSTQVDSMEISTINQKSEGEQGTITEKTTDDNGSNENNSVKQTTETNTAEVKDNTTTLNIKNKKTYKKSKKVTIKDSDGIKSVRLNTKSIKVKAGKKSVSFKLSKYKKNLKKKNKWNKLVVTDVNGNKKTIQFKVK